jgi:Leucine-rich repeat (LRR) protein
MFIIESATTNSPPTSPVKKNPVHWTLLEYAEWVRKSCPENRVVEILDLSMHGNLVSKLKIKFLIATIKNLRNLKEINLNNNSLFDLPAELAELPKLRILSLSGNNFETIPTVENSNFGKYHCLKSCISQITKSQPFHVTLQSYRILKNYIFDTTCFPIFHLKLDLSNNFEH